jgi:hypothetical protein
VSDAARLREIAYAAKAHWGYDERLVREWAEPNAIGFYEKLGARYLRDSEPSEWGRVLPVMGVSLDE